MSIKNTKFNSTVQCNRIIITSINIQNYIKYAIFGLEVITHAESNSIYNL